MKKLFAISTLALGMLAAAQSAQAAVLDGDANPIPGLTGVQTERLVARRHIVPVNAFASIVVPVHSAGADLAIDGDANKIPGLH